jgi:hypothetical protein
MTNAPAHPLPQRAGSRPSPLASRMIVLVAPRVILCSSDRLILQPGLVFMPVAFPASGLTVYHDCAFRGNESNQASADQRRDRCTSQPGPVSCLNSCSRSIPAIKLLTFLRQGASISTVISVTQPISLLPLVLAVGIKLPIPCTITPPFPVAISPLYHCLHLMCLPPCSYAHPAFIQGRALEDKIKRFC